MVKDSVCKALAVAGSNDDEHAMACDAGAYADQQKTHTHTLLHV